MMCKKKITLVITCLIFFTLIISAAFTQVDENHLKAIFLERFTRFIQWPENSNVSNPEVPFIIGFNGETPIEDIVRKIYAEKKILGKKVIVKKIEDIKLSSECNILFIAQTDKNNLEEILNHLKNKPVLTVSHNKGFAKDGVHINFFVESNKIRFRINEIAVKQSGLSVSYLLLKVADVIN